MTVKNDSSGEARQVISDSSAGNGAPGGHEAHGNFIDCVMKSVEDGVGSGFRQQSRALGEGVQNQLEVVVGNKPREHAPEVAEVQKPKAGAGEESDKALALTLNNEARMAASARGQLVFDDSIYPTNSAKSGADEWLKKAVDSQKKAA